MTRANRNGTWSHVYSNYNSTCPADNNSHEYERVPGDLQGTDKMPSLQKKSLIHIGTRYYINKKKNRITNTDSSE